ncbi:MAG: hypothetical protein Q8M65_09890 [Rhodoglobus sp.]|nr:hypothetical protein [Rhodoglobus sp.]
MEYETNASNTGPGTLELRCSSKGIREQIPWALINEAVKALGAESPLRKHIIQLTHHKNGHRVSTEEIRKIEGELTSSAHDDTKGELGIVGRLPGNAGGQIVDLGRYEALASPISSRVVLALALLRLVTLCGLDGKIVIVTPGSKVDS